MFRVTQWVLKACCLCLATLPLAAWPDSLRTGGAPGAVQSAPMPDAAVSEPRSLDGLQVDPLMLWPERLQPEIRPWPAPLPAPAAPATETSGRWSLLMEDRTLYRTLLRWTALAGWQLIWEAERDYPIESDVHLTQSFLGALGLVMDTLKDSDYPLQAVVNPGTQVVRVVRHADHRSR